MNLRAVKQPNLHDSNTTGKKMSDTNLSGKVAVVTGAARGMGRAFAHRLAALGADVAVLDVDLQAAAKFDEKLDAASVEAEIAAMGRRSIGVQVDLSDRAAATAAIREVEAKLGRIDILVNCAGGLITPMETSAASITPDVDVRKSFGVNFDSMLFCCQAAIPGMRERGHGVIVNLSSQSGVSTYPGGVMAAYAASKAAVTQYTRYLAAEVGAWGIRANCIAPGIIMTSRVAAQAASRSVGSDAQAQSLPLRRLGTPQDVARALEFLATDLSGYVTGQCLCVDGGAVLTPS
jgi:NAD(P)-dependent dehydrogenase (short-subunit alcohol dehydrogenase family)